MRPLLLGILLLMSCASAGLADSDQDRARRAVQSGSVRPLGEILSVVQRRYHEERDDRRFDSRRHVHHHHHHGHVAVREVCAR